MKKLIFLLLLPLLTGCASFNYRVVGWYNTDDEGANQVLLNNGKVASIWGNPPITCYDKYGFELADGYFVKVDGDYLVVDEYGKGYKRIRDDRGNYCILWEQQQ